MQGGGLKFGSKDLKKFKATRETAAVLRPVKGEGQGEDPKGMTHHDGAFFWMGDDGQVDRTPFITTLATIIHWGPPTLIAAAQIPAARSPTNITSSGILSS